MRIHRNPPRRFPKDFASATIATLAEMKEWKGVLGTMVTFGLVVDGSWAQIYHERVQTTLEQELSQLQPIQIMMLFNCSELSLQTWRSGKVLSLRNARITMGQDRRTELPAE